MQRIAPPLGHISQSSSLNNVDKRVILWPLSTYVINGITKSSPRLLLLVSACCCSPLASPFLPSIDVTFPSQHDYCQFAITKVDPRLEDNHLPRVNESLATATTVLLSSRQQATFSRFKTNPIIQPITNNKCWRSETSAWTIQLL